MKKTIRSIAFLLALLLLFPLLPIAADPEETEPAEIPDEPAEPAPLPPTVLENVDADLMEGLTDLPVDLFPSPAVDWTGAREGDLLSSEKELPFSPRRPFGGKYSLLAKSESKTVSVTRTFGEAEGQPRLDASRSGFFTFSIALPEADGAPYAVSVKIVSNMISTAVSTEPITFETGLSLPAGGWQTVLCDVSRFEGRGDIRSITLTVSSETQGVQAAFDTVGFLSGTAPVSSIRFLSDYYLPLGCSLTYGDTLTVTLTGSEGSLTSPALPWLLPTADTALCVKLRNPAGLKTLSLTVQRADPLAEPITSSCDVSGTGGVQYCYFPLGTDPVSTLTLTFTGSVGGEVQILSVSPISFPVSSRASLGSVTSCLLSQSGQSYEIEGSLGEDALRRFDGGTLELYSLPLGGDESSLGTTRPIASTDLTREFRFSCKLEEQNYAVLTRKFVVAISNKGVRTPIGPAFCLTNPEVLASADAIPLGTGGKKGASPITDFDDTAGLNDTVVTVPLETLFAPGTEGYAHRTDRITYYFNEETLSRLDGIAKLCRMRGTRALFALTLTSSEGVSEAYSLASESAGEGDGVTRFAFGAERDTGLNSLRAAVDLLASRYLSDPDPIGGFVGFIVGENVNETYEYYNMGLTSLSVLVRRYAAALRTVWASARAVNSEAKVYVSLSSRFGGTETRALSESFGARVFLDALDEVISSEGDFFWQPALDPYPSEDYLAYADTGAGTDSEAEYVTAANLDVLTSYISRRQFYYLGQYRPITLYEPEKPRALVGTNHEIRQSADFVYTLYKIGTRNYSLIETLIPGKGHPVNYENTLTLVDSDPSVESVTYALEVIGIGSWEQVLTGFDPTRTAARTVLESKPLSFVPSSVKGELTLFSFEKRGSVSGFEAYPVQANLNGGTTVGSAHYLSIQASPGTEWFGAAQRFPDALDLSVSPYLSLTIFPTSLPTGTEELDCRVLLSSAGNLFVSDQTLKAGETNVVILDLRAFPGLKSADTLRVLFRGKDGSDPGEPTVLLGDVRLLSEEYKDGDLKDAFDRAQDTREDTPAKEKKQVDTRIVLLLVSVMVIASTALALRLMTANRAENADGDGEDDRS